MNRKNELTELKYKVVDGFPTEVAWVKMKNGIYLLSKGFAEEAERKMAEAAFPQTTAVK